MNRRDSMAFYQTQGWRRMSRRIRHRDGWFCVRCASRGFTKEARVVHHVRPIRDGGGALEESNLTSLCTDCHREAHGQVVDEGKQEWSNYLKSLMEGF